MRTKAGFFRRAFRRGPSPDGIRDPRHGRGIFGMRKRGKRRIGWAVWLGLCIIRPSLFGGTPPIDFAKRVIESNMELTPASSLDPWSYWIGFYLLGQYRVWKTTGRASYLQVVRDWVDRSVDADGNISHAIGGLNDVQPGFVTLMLSVETGASKYRKAADNIRNALGTYPRTADGCFGMDNNATGRDQLWLDGSYMALPFYAKYGQVTGDTACLTDAARQLIAYAGHLQSPSGLLYHAYDENASAAWADRTTHHSPIFWGRSMGWYGMALVEVLDCLPDGHPKRQDLIRILADLIEGLAAVQDPDTGLWYQVVDQGGRPDNWLESSCSCMFSYITARAAAAGYVDAGYQDMARRAYEGILRDKYVVIDNHPVIRDISAGVGADSSYSYYVGVAHHATYNDQHDMNGVGAFLLMCWQMEKAGSVNAPPAIRITSPSDGACFAPDSDIPVQASASDADGAVVRVDFYRDGGLVYSDDQAPWEFTWSGAAEGGYVLTAVATDDDAATTASDPVHVSVTDDFFVREAEDAPRTLSQGTVDTDPAGFTGSGFVNLANGAGTYLELTVSVPSAGGWNMAVRYANGSANNRPCRIHMDGQIARDSHDFPSTGDWAVWGYAAPVPLTLTSGNHSLRITGLTAESAPNIDHFKFTAVSGQSRPSILGAAVPQGHPRNLTLTFSAADGADGYNVYRGPEAGFTADRAAGSNRIAAGISDQDPLTAGVQWTDNGDVIGDPAVHHFYRVTAIRGGAEGDPSDPFGEFEFGLVTTPSTDFNEIAIALEASGITSAGRLLAAVPNCNSVARWNAPLQGYEQYVPGVPPTDFAVEAGRPYYVNVSAGGVFTLLGGPADPSFDLVTTAGTDFNEVMLPLDRTGVGRASELMTDIPNCNSVARWNAPAQGYEQYIPGIPPTDFDVRTGYPYYVNVTAAVTWPAGGAAKPSSRAENPGRRSGGGAPHLVYGIMDPGAEAADFAARVAGRPGERLTRNSPGCGIRGGFWIVQCASFPSAWLAGDSVIVELTDADGRVRRTARVALSFDPSDRAVETAGRTVGTAPTRFGGLRNRPNPFNPETRLSFDIAAACDVRLVIVNSRGQRIRTLMDGACQAGTFEVVWDGMDDAGRPVGSGMVVAVLSGGGKRETLKMLKLQ
jgi:unsaturated rhamnogalacturonyl hydrolase